MDLQACAAANVLLKARRPRVLTSVVCRHRSNMVGWRGLLPWLALWAASAGPSGAYKVEKYSIAMPNVRPASVSILEGPFGVLGAWAPFPGPLGAHTCHTAPVI